ncbi:MAG TPA: SDR family oxidoreductase [Patescibacteria group bacterium]|nr:SDR family oxidoreductase [Patescibacteria group bacterium]
MGRVYPAGRMKILILGATGSIGRHLLPQAVSRGHEVTILVRDQRRLGERGRSARVVEGDALDPAAVDRAAQGQDAVIYALGTRQLFKPTTLFSDSTRILIAAMQRRGVRRLVAITGVGAGDSRGHGGFLYDRVFFPLLLARVYADKDRQEALIRQSALDWVILRPAVFTSGPERGDLRAETKLAGVTIRKISRADVASFTLDQLSDNRYVGKAPLIGY